jgi:predicted dehydrogenase
LLNYRHYPLVQHVREQLHTGERAHLVYGSYLQDWLLLERDWNWRIDPELGGPLRAVGDIGSHWIDLIQYVTGDHVTEVCADLGRLHQARLRPARDGETFAAGGGSTRPFGVTTEDFGTVLLRFSSGMRGSLTVSQVSPGRKNALQFEIATGSVGYAWDQEQPAEQAADDPFARHVVSEIARVLTTRDALLHGDRATLARAFAESHASLRDDFRVSTPELDALVAALLDAGAIAARLTGAGFGGSAVALVDSARTAEVSAATCARYRARTGLRALPILCTASAGAGSA